MRLTEKNGEIYLEHRGMALKLDGRDRLHVAKMTPMGRKVYFTHKGKELRTRRPDDPEGAILLEWSRMRAREWAFPVLVVLD
ncbi:MAG: hypothetical protein JWP91_1129 [Fibrobacteres bacterium]|nr:hypothetical protein [Fibrobacterota bacterium]